MDKDIHATKSKDEDKNHGMAYDKSDSESYTSWTMEERIAGDDNMVPFINQVVENIATLDSSNVSQVNDVVKSVPKVIFDIGCGAGEVMDYIIKQMKPTLTGDKIFHGMDLSPSMIEIARKNYYRKSNDNNDVKCLFHIQDMHNLMNVEDHSVDFMYSCYVFQHSDHIIELFKHLSTKLKCGGKLTFLMDVIEPRDKSKGFPSGYLSNKWVPLKLPNVVVMIYGHTLTEWCFALEQAGFTWKVLQNLTPDNPDGPAPADDGYVYKDDIAIRGFLIDATLIK